MQKGDIVLIRFPFTDFSGNKNRPALVLASSEMDITVAFISTQLKWKEDTDLFIKPNKYNGLKKESLLRLRKLATIDKDFALGRLGLIDDKALKLVNQNLIKILSLQE